MEAVVGQLRILSAGRGVAEMLQFFSKNTVFCGLAFLIGVLYAFIMLPADMLLDRWSWWESVRGDNAAGLVGYLAWASDEWRFPLFYTYNLNPESGANIIYTDPVPLMALVGKVVAKITGYTPLYMGKWTVFCWGMQGLLSAIILRRLGSGALLSLLGAALMVLLPVVAFRFGHIGLVAQFVILLAILFYFDLVAGVSRCRAIFYSVVIGGVLFINPYLMAMCMAIYMAGVLDSAVNKRISFLFSAILLVVALSTAGVLAYVFGIIGQPGGVPSGGGFGFYSMNLLSPIWPQLSPVLGQRDIILDPTGGQYEGMNYLGAGAILVLIVALGVGRGGFFTFMRKHPFLIFICLLLFIYAISTNIYIGHVRIAHIPYDAIPVVDRITSIFRGSGRFFWPVAFVLVLLGVSVVATKLPRRWAVSVMGVALLFQAYDAKGMKQYVTFMAEDMNQRSFDLSPWREIMSAHSELVVLPGFVCIDGGRRADLLQIQVLAVSDEKPLGSAYINRGGECVTDYSGSSFDDLATTDNPLVLLLDVSLFAKSNAIGLIEAEWNREYSCREVEIGYLCAKDVGGALSTFGSEIHYPVIPLGRRLEVLPDAEAADFLVKGWSGPEAAGRWAEGEVTSIIGRLPHQVCEFVTFEARVSPLAADGYVTGAPVISLNGGFSQRAQWIFDGINPISARFDLNGNCIDRVDFQMRFDEVRSPKDLGLNEDLRNLSLFFQSYEFNAR